MTVTLRDKLISDSIDIVCEVDGVPLSQIMAVSYEQSVNSARVVKIRIGGKESMLLVRVGGRVVLKGGRNETTHNLDFTGIITQTSPGIGETEVVAVDYITFLQTSELVEYKEGDVIGHDLYYLASVACDYKDIDTSELIEGSGIKATADMDLVGLQTRRQFIDKCFQQLVEVVEDTFHPEPTAIRWRYGIRRGRVMDFWLEDHTNFKTEPILTISPHSDNLVGPGVVSKVDTLQMINSSTYQSSSNPDIYATVTDNSSVEKYGVYGKLHLYDTTRIDKLHELAYITTLLHKEPAYAYKIVMTNGEHITVGDYVRVKELSYDKDIILPVVAVSHQITDSIESLLVVGTPELHISDLLASMT